MWHRNGIGMSFGSGKRRRGHFDAFFGNRIAHRSHFGAIFCFRARHQSEIGMISGSRKRHRSHRGTISGFRKLCQSHLGTTFGSQRSSQFHLVTISGSIRPRLNEIGVIGETSKRPGMGSMGSAEPAWDPRVCNRDWRENTFFRRATKNTYSTHCVTIVNNLPKASHG